MYKINFDYSPVYELLVSLRAFANKSYHKNIDLGKAWLESVKEKISLTLVEDLERTSVIKDNPLSIEWLIYQCPEKQSIKGFLKWLANLSTAEIFELLAPYVESIPNNIIDIRDQTVNLLSRWNEEYFVTVNSSIFKKLSEDIIEKNKLKTQMGSEELFEEVTNGIRQHSTEELKEVIMVPQYHISPITNSIHYSHTIFCFYACSTEMEGNDGPPLKLMRLTRCLSDESRMQILKYISSSSKGFMEIVKHTGLSKSTVHHHLVSLRAAGLLIVEGERANVVSYRLREDALEKLQQLLKQYFYQ